MGLAKTTETFTATGQSEPVQLHGRFNISLSGFGAGAVALQRSFDAGATWLTVESWAADFEGTANEPEINVLYRLNCTAYTSGSIVGRLSQ